MLISCCCFAPFIELTLTSTGFNSRFLCPPPTAVMVGNSWWSEVRRNGEEPTLAPPRVVVSISGEPTPPESSVEWAGASGKPFDATDPPNGTTFVGRCVGKQLFISEADEKRKKVEALVKVTAPSVGDEEGKVIGLFPSKPIKVISKPSKKRQSAKNLECMCFPGSIISFLHPMLISFELAQCASIMVRPYPCFIVCDHRRCRPNTSVSRHRALRSKDPTGRL